MLRDIFTAVLHLLSVQGAQGRIFMNTEATMANTEPNNANEAVKTDHRATYDNFMSVTKWGVAAVSVVLILMAIFLA